MRNLITIVNYESQTQKHTRTLDAHTDMYTFIITSKNKSY